MQLVLSRFIEHDLDAIASFIAQGSPRRAVSFIREIREKFYDIGRTPLIYRLRPDIGEGARMASIGNYAILFRVIGNVVRIERVVFSGRNLPEVFDTP